MPRARWTPFLVASGASVLNSDGLLTISHQYLRDAVEARYLNTPKSREGAHQEVHDYIGSIKERTKRQSKEYIWQGLRLIEDFADQQISNRERQASVRKAFGFNHSDLSSDRSRTASNRGDEGARFL